MPRTRKNTRKKGSASASTARVPALDIKSAADVKKALNIMKNHPLTIVLVFANWCPHCHTFMSRWNKLKGIPNRTSPMISVEQQYSNELLSNISDETGKPPQIEGYPTVIASTNRGAQNVGMQVSTASDKALARLATSSNNMNVENENNASNENENMNASNENENMNTSNENNNMNDSFAASYFSESAEKKNKGNVRSAVVSGRRVKKLSAILENAVENASNRASASVKEAKRLRGKADEELSFPNSEFASPPPAENSTMNGGSCGATGTCGVPSGLIRLQGGASQQPTLYSLLNGLKGGEYFEVPTGPRKETRRRNRKQRK